MSSQLITRYHWLLTIMLCIFGASLAANQSSGNVVRTDIFVHPQLIKFVKHHIYIWYWCGSPLEWVYPQLPHQTVVCTVGCKHNSREDFYSLAKEGSCIMVRTDAYAHPHHEKLAKYLLCVWYRCGSPPEWEWVNSLNHCTWWQNSGENSRTEQLRKLGVNLLFLPWPV